MEKKIKTNYMELDLTTTTIEVVNINGFRFEHDEDLVGVQVYSETQDDAERVLIDEFEPETTVVDIDDLKVVALNWYFNNVEIVKDVI